MEYPFSQCSQSSSGERGNDVGGGPLKMSHKLSSPPWSKTLSAVLTRIGSPVRTHTEGKALSSGPNYRAPFFLFLTAESTPCYL